MEPTEITGIEAEVYFSDTEKDRYYINVSFVGTGMYINSFAVQPSKFDGEHYWVQPPKIHLGFGKYKPVVEFAKKDYPLWEMIELKALEAVDNYKQDLRASKNKHKDVVITDIPEGPINLDDIPF